MVAVGLKKLKLVRFGGLFHQIHHFLGFGKL